VTLSVGEKGRVVLPAALRREAGVQVGDELVARVVGPHQILVETKEAVAARLRARFRDGGGTDDLRRARFQGLGLSSSTYRAQHRVSGSGSPSLPSGTRWKGRKPQPALTAGQGEGGLT
jgi:bifunctional DNA-binding transcriptional regulator/antitoxin component of YhaV-PrlF toxin-antitoxin module